MAPSEQEELLDACILEYRNSLRDISWFGKSVRGFFTEHPVLSAPPLPAVHSVRFRLKEESHLKDKIIRKISSGRKIVPGNLLDSITDLAGVRVLHLNTEQFGQINNAIEEYVGQGKWHYFEPPRAYTWDPESSARFQELGIGVQLKDTYTSVHYLRRS